MLFPVQRRSVVVGFCDPTSLFCCGATVPRGENATTGDFFSAAFLAPGTVTGVTAGGASYAYVPEAASVGVEALLPEMSSVQLLEVLPTANCHARSGME